MCAGLHVSSAEFKLNPAGHSAADFFFYLMVLIALETVIGT